MRGIRLSNSAVDPILDVAEKGLVMTALAVLRASLPRDSSILWAHLKRVGRLGVALDEAPSLVVPATYGGALADEATLLTELSESDPFGTELHLPEKSVVARAFLWDKIALLRGFGVALERVPGGVDDGLVASFRFELAQSIYTAIATEILVGLVADGELDRAIRLSAVRQLVRIWERAAVIEIDDFCPMLEAAWRARSRCAARFGTLLATVEYVRLVQEDCPLEFLDHFTSDRVSSDAVQAFEEFLFDLTHEELGRVHAAMRAEGCTAVDAAFVSRVVGRRIPAASSADDPDALFTSYRRRSAAAAYRRVAASAGPRRVAEAYTMIELLNHAAA